MGAPLLVSGAAVPLYGIIDTAIVGRLGTDELAGVALATTMITVASWCCLFLTKSTVTNVASAVAQGSRPTDHVTVATVTALALGAVWMLILTVTGPPLADALSSSHRVTVEAVAYLRWSAIGIPGVCCVYVMHGFLQAVGRMRSSLVLGVATAGINLGLELAFVYGLRLGVTGSACGTTLAVSGAGAWSLRALRRTGVLGGRGAVSATGVRLLLADGLRQGIGSIAILATVSTATAVASAIGPTAVGAHQVALQLYVLCGAVVQAIATPAQVLVATAIARGAAAEARQWATSALVTAGCVSTVLLLGLALPAGHIARFFTADPVVASSAATLVVLAGAQQLVGSPAYVTDAVLLAEHRSGRLAVNNVLAFAAFALVLSGTVLVTHVTASRLWLALIAWMSVRAALNAAAFRPRRPSLGRDGPCADGDEGTAAPQREQ